LILLLVGIPASTIVSREAGTDDPSFVVLDEVVGQWIALVGATLVPWSWLLAFLLFRAFDIWKPAPARQFDRMHSGFGIMMDDVAAGVYALILVAVASRYL
jgi:phosphatidylglycerophosphatase A